jgi:hypothetical protein
MRLHAVDLPGAAPVPITIAARVVDANRPQACTMRRSTARESQREQAVLHGEQRRPCPGGDTDFRVDVLDVMLGRAR